MGNLESLTQKNHIITINVLCYNSVKPNTLKAYMMPLWYDFLCCSSDVQLLRTFGYCIISHENACSKTNNRLTSMAWY